MKNFKGKKANNRKNYKGSSRDNKYSYPDKTTINENDISWYTRYPSLIGPNASINFNLRYGAKVPNIDQTSTVIWDDVTSATSTPGVVVRDFVPMYADSATEASAVNVATKNLFTWVRHANSGSTNYESSDLMQYVITAMNLYTMIEQAKRDIRLIHTYKSLNSYIGAVTVSALHTTTFTADLLDNTAKYVGILNTIVAKMNSLKIPKEISILDRHVWLVSNVFKDDNLDKYTQYINYCPYMAHYDWANHTVEIRALDRINVNSLNTILQAINAEVDNLLQYEDTGTMLGDFLKSYKVENCRVIAPMQLGEILEPVTSLELLDQYRNYIIPASQTNLSNLDYDVKQLSANTQIVYAEQVGFTRTDGFFTYSVSSVGTINQPSYGRYKPVLTIDSDNPSSEEVILNSRQSLCFNFDTNVNSTAVVESYATELPARCILYAYIGADSGKTFNISENMIGGYYFSTLNLIGTFSDVNTSTDDMLELLTSLNQMHKVTGTPQYCIYADWFNTDDSTKFAKQTNYYSGKNVITLEADWLDRLHTACKLSEWSMPMFKLLES